MKQPIQHHRTAKRVLQILFIIELVILLVAAILFFFIPTNMRSYYLVLLAFLVINVVFLHYFTRRNFKQRS